jgi:S-sulfo-L-cysteine synthase (3-phospho-L-serine-dependent)
VRGLAAVRRLPGVSAVAIAARAGTPVRPAADAYDRLGWVIAAGDSPAQVAAVLDEAAALVEIDVLEPVGQPG